MNKRAFTLVELLSVIVILGVVSLIVFPTISNTIKTSKQKLYNNQISILKSAGKKWATENINELDKDHVNDTYIPLSMLKDTGYLNKDKILNPQTKKEMNGCIKISYDYLTKTYNYDYQEYEGVEINNTCQTSSGYVYLFSGSWQRNTDNAMSSFIDLVLKQNPLTASGSGLYEEAGFYYFRGGTVNNYVTINSDVWRIISIDKINRTVKLIRDNYAYNSFWDNGTNIQFVGSADSTGTVIPSNALNQLNNYYSSNTSSINVNSFNKKILENASWNVGSIDEDHYDLDKLMMKEKDKKIVSNIGLITVSDYVNASIDNACNDDFRNSCKLDNYLYNLMASSVTWGGSWTINNNGSDKIWYIGTDGVLGTKAPNAGTYSIFPVIQIQNNVEVKTNDGTIGSRENPYQIS